MDYRKALEQGHVPANRALGSFHAAAERWPEALQWHKKGILAGDAECMAAIAEHYLEGRGVALSKEKAATWLERALEASKASSSQIDEELLSRLARLLADDRQEL